MGNPVKLGRKAAHRKAMLRTLATQLLQHERIQTTVARAKALRPIVDRLITHGKEGTKHAHNKAAAVVTTERELHKLFTSLAERYRPRPGGYTRVVRTGLRQHDTAKLAYIELVDRPGELRPARPPPSLSHLPAAAQLALQQAQQQQPAAAAAAAASSKSGGEA